MEKRPSGVTLLAILLIISSIYAFIIIFQYTDIIFYGNIYTHYIFLFYVFVVGILGFLIAYGLLKGSNWGWNAALILTIVAAVINVITGSSGQLIINFIIIFYLIRPNVLSYFNKKIDLKRNTIFGSIIIAILVISFTIFISPSIPLPKNRYLYPTIRFGIDNSNNSSLIVEDIDYEIFFGSSSELIWENIEIDISEANASLPSGSIGVGDTVYLTNLTTDFIRIRVIWKPMNRVIWRGNWHNFN